MWLNDSPKNIYSSIKMTHKVCLSKLEDIGYLDELLFGEDGLPCVVDAADLKDVEHMHLIQWCVQNAVYQIPTKQLIEWLGNEINGRNALEVCAGKSGIGRALGIISTDSYSQTTPELRVYYALMQQPVVEPPDYVKRMEANAAVAAYKPEVVIGCYVTQKFQEGDTEAKIGSNIYGPDEFDFIKVADTYIHVGNEVVHKDKRIFSLPHDVFHFDWLYSRAFNPQKNAIWKWNKHPLRM